MCGGTMTGRHNPSMSSTKPLSEITTSRGGYEEHEVSSLPRGRRVVSWLSRGTRPNSTTLHPTSTRNCNPPRRSHTGLGFGRLPQRLVMPHGSPRNPNGVDGARSRHGHRFSFPANLFPPPILALWCLGLCVSR